MISRSAIRFAAAFSALLAGPALAADPTVHFIGLETGAIVASPLTVRFGLSGMGVALAGTEKDGTGHHHLLIDRAPWGQGPDDAGHADTGLPADDRIRHFGGGQTDVTLTLAPGPHSLQLLMGDAYHVPIAPTVASARIEITVR
jgi:hypothetical protein